MSPKQLQMENTTEVRVGAFVWKIGDLSSVGVDGEKSPEFKFGKYRCYLDIFEYDMGNPAHSYRVDLNALNGETISYNYKTFCKLCLIDGHGKECERKQTTLALASSSYVPLMTIFKYDLDCKGNYHLSEGVTLRLSWCDKGDSNREQGTQTASDLNSEEEPRTLLETLSEDFGRFYGNKVDTDFLLRVGEDQIPVHRAVLSARSEVFAAMFRHDTSENQSGVVDIPDVDASVLRDVLFYVYSEQTRGMSADTICPMYEVADKYALLELRVRCLNFLLRSLTVENVCDAALLAHTHGETKLGEEVVQFIKENLEEIEETDKWKEFLKSKSSLAFKLIRSALMISKDEIKSLSSK